MAWAGRVDLNGTATPPRPRSNGATFGRVSLVAMRRGRSRPPPRRPPPQVAPEDAQFDTQFTFEELEEEYRVESVSGARTQGERGVPCPGGAVPGASP